MYHYTTHLALGPEDAGAEQECKQQLVPFEQSPRNSAIHSLGALLEEQLKPHREPLVSGVQRIHNAVVEKELTEETMGGDPSTVSKRWSSLTCTQRYTFFEDTCAPSIHDI